MGSHLAPDQVMREHQKAMGLVLGTEFHGLYNECAWLYLKWRNYRALFGTSQDR
jgi:hypothetical protein